MKEAHVSGQILVGQRTHCILHGGKNGVVAAVPGTQSPGSCRDLGGIGVAGGNACLDLIWDDGTESRRIPFDGRTSTGVPHGGVGADAGQPLRRNRREICGVEMRQLARDVCRGLACEAQES